MKYILILLVALVWSCSSKKSPVDAHQHIQHSSDSSQHAEVHQGVNKRDTSISVQLLDSILQSNAPVYLLDVRTPEEIAAGQIRNTALKIDIQQQGFESRVANLDKDATYFVYCKAGIRSSRAQSIMESLGFSHVINVEGGITAWTQAGHSLELP